MNIAEESDTVAAGAASAETRAAYFAEADRRGLSPLWEVMRHATPRQPVPVSLPHHWRWRDVRPFVLAAGKLLSAWEAERRVLMLINPACELTSFRAVGLIYAGIQHVMLGETAPTHRHVPNVQRFVIEVEGAYTNVDGEHPVMARGDFVLTPGWGQDMLPASDRRARRAVRSMASFCTTATPLTAVPRCRPSRPACNWYEVLGEEVAGQA